MKSSIPSTPATTASSAAFVWGRNSKAENSLLEARSKDLEAQMYYGPGFDPPVNNAIVPNLYNKLDAQCKERTRVMNKVLDKRLGVQERVLNRHQDVSEKIYAKEKAKLKDDLRKIGKRLPSFAKLYQNIDMELLEREVKKQPVQLSSFGMNVPEERHYCFRYFEHHNPVRIARRISEGIKKDVKKLEKTMEDGLPAESSGVITEGANGNDTSTAADDQPAVRDVRRRAEGNELLQTTYAAGIETSDSLKTSNLPSSPVLASLTTPSTEQRTAEPSAFEEDRSVKKRRNSHRSGTSCSF